MTELATRVDVSPFDALRHEDERGEFWLASEIYKPLGYTWRKFPDVIERARLALEMNGEDPGQHIEASTARSTPQNGYSGREWRLTRYGAYTVVQGGDPSKPAIAAGWAYFRTKTREAELAPAIAPRSTFDVLRVAIDAIEQATLRLDGHDGRLNGHARAIERQSVAIAEHGARLDRINTAETWFTCVGFAKLHGIRQCDRQTMNLLGRRAGKLLRATGAQPGKVPDGRDGTHNTYPEHVLAQAIRELGLS